MVAYRAASRLGQACRCKGKRGAGSGGERREERRKLHEGWTNGFMTRPGWVKQAAVGWVDEAPRLVETVGTRSTLRVGRMETLA